MKMEGPPEFLYLAVMLINYYKYAVILFYMIPYMFLLCYMDPLAVEKLSS